MYILRRSALKRYLRVVVIYIFCCTRKLSDSETCLCAADVSEWKSLLRHFNSYAKVLDSLHFLFKKEKRRRVKIR